MGPKSTAPAQLVPQGGDAGFDAICDDLASAGFDAICDDLAGRIGTSRIVIDGAGHEIQFAGNPLNDALLALWRNSSAGFTSPIM